MPSKYSAKIPKAIQKQDATLPYKRHWVAPRIAPKCTNCGRTGIFNPQFSKCGCGGTLQTYSH